MPPESGTIVVLHACRRTTPSGYDITPAQWDQVIAARSRHARLTPFLTWYSPGLWQRRCRGRRVIREARRRRSGLFVSTSFSGAFALRRARVLLLSLLPGAGRSRSRVLSQLKIAIRNQLAHSTSSPSTAAPWWRQGASHPLASALWGKELAKCASAHQVTQLVDRPEGRRRQAG